MGGGGGSGGLPGKEGRKNKIGPGVFQSGAESHCRCGTGARGRLVLRSCHTLSRGTGTHMHLFTALWHVRL